VPARHRRVRGQGQQRSRGGGVAAVIYNNVASDPTCADFYGTLGDGVTSTIPAISLSCQEGAEALAKVARTVRS